GLGFGHHDRRTERPPIVTTDDLDDVEGRTLRKRTSGSWPATWRLAHHRGHPPRPSITSEPCGSTPRGPRSCVRDGTARPSTCDVPTRTCRFRSPDRAEVARKGARPYVGSVTCLKPLTSR